MNTKMLNWIILAIVVICAIWFIATLPRGGQQTPTATSTTVTSTTTVRTAPSTNPVTQGGQKPGPAPVKKPAAIPANLQGIGTVANLIDFHMPLACSMTTTGSVKRSGSLFLAERKYRVDFPTASMINDGSYLYVWKTGATSGLKLLSSLAVSGSVMATNGGFDPATDITYACAPWLENPSFFVPPASVLFSNTP
jgi:hypothetical protein